MDAIFLSASIPKPGREYHGTADPLLIHAAIRALLLLVLGRRHIVWGGHPSITPLVSAACDGLGVHYADAVTLYQSRFFQNDFPAENSRFGNMVLVDAEADMTASLQALRTRMFADHTLKAGRFYRRYERYSRRARHVCQFAPGSDRTCCATAGRCGGRPCCEIRLRPGDGPRANKFHPIVH